MLDCDIDEQSFNGNLINWKSVTSWDIHNVTIENIDNICNEDSIPEFMIFNQRMPFNQIKFSCEVMGGTLPHQFDKYGSLFFYDNVLAVFKRETDTKQSPCMSTYDGVEKVKYWIGYKLISKLLKKLHNYHFGVTITINIIHGSL